MISELEHLFAYYVHLRTEQPMTIFDLITQAIREQLRAGRTQADLARELGLSQTTVSAIRRGTRRVGRRTAEAVLAADPPWLRERLRTHGR
jgi:transcriptional regulator with XRE-family HTH domain